jgi:hypothetical protein
MPVSLSKIVSLAVAIALVVSTSLLAASVQDSSAMNGLPATTIIDRAVSLQTSLYPAFYEDSTAALDMLWVSLNDTDLVRFWHESGDSILAALAQLSGLTWREEVLPLYFVRYHPSLGSADPLIMPICGIKNGPVTEAIPRGAVIRFNLIYLLAERIIEAGTAPTAISSSTFARSPLAQPGPFFRDNLALLLAYAVSQRVLGSDSTRAAYTSNFLKGRFPGKEFYERGLRDQWVLMPDKPLALYLVNEPDDSKLITMAYSLAANSNQPSMPKRMSIEGLPSKGQLGFSIRVGNSNQMIVESIDTLRIAYRAGLRKNDIIRSVNGQRVRLQRDLMETVIDNLESGVTLQVSRNDKNESVFIRSKLKGQ